MTTRNVYERDKTISMTTHHVPSGIRPSPRGKRLAALDPSDQVELTGHHIGHVETLPLAQGFNAWKDGPDAGIHPLRADTMNGTVDVEVDADCGEVFMPARLSVTEQYQPGWEDPRRC
jgi:hypothetical protein